jgi:hypothetical protein
MFSIVSSLFTQEPPEPERNANQQKNPLAAHSPSAPNGLSIFTATRTVAIQVLRAIDRGLSGA